jgi:RNA polymerase sigma-70 factor, ECF subfamily
MAETPEALYEQTLVIRSQLGDEAAFEELLHRHGPRLLLFTQRMLQSSPESVADVVQEVWVAIYRALPRLLDVSKFRPWAFRIARDRIYRDYRRRRWPVQTEEEAQLAEVAGPMEVDLAIDREAVHRCLELISPEHREALVLRFFEEMSYEEIAAITGSSVGTVRSRIHYGKAALKKAWKGKLYESPT